MNRSVCASHVIDSMNILENHCTHHYTQELGLTSTSSSASGASYSSSTGSSSATSSSTLLVPIASSEYEYEVMATYLASNRLGLCTMCLQFDCYLALLHI